MTATWTKVEATHKVEGSREEWRLELDGRLVGRISREADGWNFAAVLDQTSVSYDAAGNARTFKLARRACESILPAGTEVRL